MGYAVLKLVHLGAVVVWVGGMFFAHFCLRPAAAMLPLPQRVALMADVLGRFFNVVLWASLAAVGSGVAMVLRVAQTTRQTGAAFNMGLDWMAMALLGLAMLAIFAYVRLAPFARLQRALVAQDWPAGGAALGLIRHWVTLNLGLGALIIVIALVGALG